MSIRTLFVTRLYEADLNDPAFVAELGAAANALAAEDRAGRAWSKANGYAGYTSYASLDDLPVRDPAFGELKRRLEPHVRAFGEACGFELGGKRLKLDSLWVNVLKPGAAHSAHLHPHSVVSGTVYVAVPEGAGGLKLEDPRLPMMMAAPPRRPDAPEDAQSFVYVAPKPGTVLLWESWLKHEVPPGRARAERISVSFNYRW